MTTESGPDEPRQDDDLPHPDDEVPPAGDAAPPASGFPPPAGSVPPPASGFPPPAGDFPPPNSGFPPPAGGFTPFTGGPPSWAAPGTGGYATRFGLVRPYQGRYISGVCAALGRATNTDPVLWRVILPVLTLFNGMGAVLYVLGILLIPADGDGGSPVEALAGRGRSATSRTLTIVLLIAAVIGIAAGAFHVGGSLIIAVVVIAAIAMFSASRNGRNDSWAATHLPTMTRTEGGLTINWPSAPAAAATPGTVPVADQAPPGTSAPGTSTSSMNSSDLPTPTVASAGGWSTTTMYADDPKVDSDGWTPDPDAPDGTALLRDAATYQQPFAPHGPFASAYPEVFPEPSVAPPAQPPAGKPRTPMRRISLSLAVLAVGVLGLLDVTNAVSAPAPAYFAVALAVIGAFLFFGSFFGRVRGPITIGVILVILLLISSAAETLPRPYSSRDVTFAPTGLSALQSDYHLNYGTLTLDLSKTPFTSSDSAAVNLSIKFGEIDIILPPDVDVIINAQAKAGDLDVFDTNHGGVHTRTGTITDYGADGKGGGTLKLDVLLDAGHLDIRR